MKNIFTTTESEFIMDQVIKGESVEFAKAKICQGIINNIGPSYSDATDEMKKEYRGAKELLKSLGYVMEVGYLKKI